MKVHELGAERPRVRQLSGYGSDNLRVQVALAKLRELARSGAKIGAGNGIRTRDFDLGKVALYH